MRGPAIFAQYGQIWGLASMAVERTVATIKYRSYESSGGRLGKFLALNQVHIIYKHRELCFEKECRFVLGGAFVGEEA